jgi:excisionase family DNA binding protein
MNVHAKPGALESEGREVLEALATLTRVVLELRDRVARLEAQTPRPRLEFPPGYLSVKEASAACGFREPTIYSWIRRGHVDGLKLGGAVRVNPESLPLRPDRA